MMVEQLVAELSDLVADHGSDQTQSFYLQVGVLIRGGLEEDFSELDKHLLENSPEFLTVRWTSAHRTTVVHWNIPLITDPQIVRMNRHPDQKSNHQQTVRLDRRCGRRVEGHRVLDESSDVRRELPSIPRGIPSLVEQDVAQPTMTIEGQREFGPWDSDVVSEKRRLEIQIVLVSANSREFCSCSLTDR
jgi:hypothetical protein